MFAPLIIPLLIVIVVPSTLTPPNVPPLPVPAVGSVYVNDTPATAVDIAVFICDVVEYAANVVKGT